MIYASRQRKRETIPFVHDRILTQQHTLKNMLTIQMYGKATTQNSIFDYRHVLFKCNTMKAKLVQEVVSMEEMRREQVYSMSIR